MDLLTLIQSRYGERYDWHFDLDSLSLVSGVVPAMNHVCRALLAEGEAAITVTPVYYPFLAMGQNSDRELIQVAAEPCNDTYPYPLEALRTALKQNRHARLLLLCNPWNPVGRVLSRPELEAIAVLAHEFDLMICSDEIHFELLFDDNRHICIANLNEDMRQRTVTVSAATKTFNIAGLGGAWVIIENPNLKAQFERFGRGLNQGNNPLTVVATRAALAHCEDWRVSLIEHLQSNRALLRSTIEQIKGISMNEIQGTYLAWLNIQDLHLSDPAAFFEARGLGLSLGAQFGAPGYMRLNMGCTQATMREACKRLSSI
jgi:cystathionine beta-lyase